MRIAAGRLTIDAAASGRITAVAPSRTPERACLDLVDLGTCRRAGAAVDWTEREVAIDPDEIAQRLVAPGLEIMVRHSFSAGWTTRLVIVNTGSAAALLERVEVVVRPAPGHRVSAQAAGSRLCWAVQAADGEGPVLAARLAAGAVSRVTEDSFELGPLQLAAGQRYVAQFRWELLATPRSVLIGPGRDVLVETTTYAVGESALLPADPDAALVTPAEVGTDLVPDADHAGREVFALDPGRYRIELRSADGDVRLDLSWVRPPDEQLATWAVEVLAGPRTPAGIVAVDALPAALVLQAALGAGDVEDGEQAGDALDRCTARLIDEGLQDERRGDLPAAVDRVGPAALAVLYLLGEHGRTGDDDILDAALERLGPLLGDDGPVVPGLGLAALRTVLAVGGSSRQDRLAPLLLRAVQRVDWSAAAGGSTDQAAELELLLAVRPLLPADHPAQRRLPPLVRSLGAALGSGLPGRLLKPPPVAEHAHRIAVLQMLPEEGSAEPALGAVTRSWGAPPGLLAHRQTLDLLDRLTGAAAGQLDGAVGSAAAWLALAPRRV